jgi:hypothetical protein
VRKTFISSNNQHPEHKFAFEIFIPIFSPLQCVSYVYFLSSHFGTPSLQVLGDPALRQEWQQELKEFADRIMKMRKLIYDRYRGCH